MKKTNTIFLTIATALMVLASATLQAGSINPEAQPKVEATQAEAKAKAVAAAKAEAAKAEAAKAKAKAVAAAKAKAKAVAAAKAKAVAAAKAKEKAVAVAKAKEKAVAVAKAKEKEKEKEKAVAAAKADAAKEKVMENAKSSSVELGCINDDCGAHMSARSGTTNGDNWDKLSIASPHTVESVSEPAIIALFALGLVGIGLARRRQS
jgi:membrane protein involved in colicin uptake